MFYQLTTLIILFYKKSLNDIFKFLLKLTKLYILLSLSSFKTFEWNKIKAISRKNKLNYIVTNL